MAMRQIQVADDTLVIHELEDVCDPATGRALTGSWIWASALVLSNWMTNQSRTNFSFLGKTVLELGAGAGLPGLTAARLGASQVVLTDIKPLLPGLLKNVEANGLGEQVKVRELMWGSDESLSEVGEFDLVLMSDVFYNAEEMVGLAKTLKCVCNRKTTVLAATEVRPSTAECLSEFVREGFMLVELPSEFASSEGMDTESLDSFAIFQVIPPHEESQMDSPCNRDHRT
ncbi:putative lysine methyltransferase, S-adenosyl-L-methionine-dependent methyltransferase [Rosa chinensis]|uniref:Putative lysine methyltransferase, S-adenosyl-L-methionine-dependent methyltransferase n=1 Tax=Rosa chinensis TaxID=74649 RepID=A0A2P6P9K2_ROSCH|nr:protein N-lysine methyltransferase METTL21A [Rosa chinensis]PRQ18611.1 putative lysine methyltransferase, S-adenosyl-L-methionine-dependent methyltransferase [Rosa chinensis]